MHHSFRRFLGVLSDCARLTPTPNGKIPPFTRYAWLCSLVITILALLAYSHWHQTTLDYVLKDLGPGVSLDRDKLSIGLTPAEPVSSTPSPSGQEPGLVALPIPVKGDFYRYRNAAGQAAWSEYRRESSRFNVHSFFSDRGHVMDIGTLGGKRTKVNGLNAAGHVVGWSQTASGHLHAFVWRTGMMTDLGTLGGNDSEAQAINDRDQIVGKSQTSTAEFHACLWSQGAMTDLGLLPGGTESGACALNNQGRIVGWAINRNVEQHAVLWEAGQIHDLNYRISYRSGLVLRQARGIGEREQILVDGMIKDTPHTFLLLPR